MPILYPAIDLKEGACVRLVKGDMKRATIYNQDPADQARAFCDAGFSWVHIVDLDGAFAGESRNTEAVQAILAATKNRLKVQLGGGIRNSRQIERWLDRGVDRVILGTAAVRDPLFVRRSAQKHPGQIAVGIDARRGQVAVEGWAEISSMTAYDLARRFVDAGVAAIIYTDIDRDGILAGINWGATIALAQKVPVPIIASGGLASLADVERLAAPDARLLDGAITGRALYDGRLDAVSALRILKAATLDDRRAP